MFLLNGDEGMTVVSTMKATMMVRAQTMRRIRRTGKRNRYLEGDMFLMWPYAVQVQTSTCHVQPR